MVTSQIARLIWDAYWLSKRIKFRTHTFNIIVPIWTSYPERFMKNTGCCKLCDQESILQKSHIIPRSLIKDLKAGDSQLYTFSLSQSPVYNNADPKELLFCRKKITQDTHF